MRGVHERMWVKGLGLARGWRLQPRGGVVKGMVLRAGGICDQEAGYQRGHCEAGELQVGVPRDWLEHA